MKAALCHVCV